VPSDPCLGEARKGSGAGARPATRGMMPGMTIEQILSAIRALPVAERLRVIELAAHDVANDVTGEAPEVALTEGVALIERHGFLVARGEPGVTLPEATFDHRPDREVRADLLWGRS
jgi:hypothetical protein